MVGTMGKAVVVVLFIAVIAIGAFVLSGADIPLRGGVVTPPAELQTTPTITGGQNFDGTLLTTFDGRDSNDPAITYSGITVYDTICYERIGDNVRDWEVLDGGDDSTSNEAQSIMIRKTTQADIGITEMWCGIVVESGGNVLVDKDATIRANSRIDTAIYEDPNLDQTAEWVYRVNLLDISPTDPNTTPSLELRLKFMEQASTANLDQSVTDLINIGTGTVDNRIKNNVDFVTTSTQNDSGAKALSQIQISVNATNGDDSLYDINNSMIEVPMGDSIQRIKLSQMDESPLTSVIIYKWKYDQATGQRDVASANFIVVIKNGDPEVDFPIIFQTRFATATDALCIELELEYVDSFNVFSNTSNDVELVAGTVNASPCTL